MMFNFLFTKIIIFFSDVVLILLNRILNLTLRLFHIVQNFQNYLATRWQIDLPTPPHDPLPDFSTCPKLNELLQNIQTHILGSQTTLETYVSICQLFNQCLEESHRVPALKTSPDTIRSYFQFAWPSFTPLEKKAKSESSDDSDDSDPLIWGWVRKTNTANEILLNTDLVRTLESAPENTHIFMYVKTLLLVTVFHELCHTLTKQLFHARVTPPGCGTDGRRNGESGDLLEDWLFGGRVVTLWRFGGVGDMGKITSLLFIHAAANGMTSFLTPDHCCSVIDSVVTGRLLPFIPPCSPTESYVAQPGDERCRLASQESVQLGHLIGSQVPIYGVKSLIGLGIQGVWVRENGVRRPAVSTDRF